MEMVKVQELKRSGSYPWRALLPALALCMALGLAACADPAAQTPTFTWSRTAMDTTAFPRAAATPQMTAILDQYKPQMDARMNQVLGHTTCLMRKERPESALSNFAVDGLVSVARAFWGEEAVDFGLINFGGIRTHFPKGDLRLYDVYSAFPFHNALVLVDLKGEVVLELFRHFAQHSVQVLSREVRLDIVNKRVALAQIQGRDIEPEKVYHLATVDFLLGGGDGLKMLARNQGVKDSGILMADVLLTYIQEFTKAGESLPAYTDGRVTVR